MKKVYKKVIKNSNANLEKKYSNKDDYVHKWRWTEREEVGKERNSDIKWERK